MPDVPELCTSTSKSCIELTKEGCFLAFLKRKVVKQKLVLTVQIIVVFLASYEFR